MRERHVEIDTQNTHQTPNEQFSSRYQEPGHASGFSRFCDNAGKRPPLVFSHLEHTPVAGDSDCVPFQGGVEQNQHHCLSCCARKTSEASAVHGSGWEQDGQLLTQLQSLTVSPSSGIRRMREEDGAAPQLFGHDYLQRGTESSESGCACGGHTPQWAWSRGCHGNCRDEALGVGYVDDVTVEDLAGYFDQMLHLPRPMSDMAQLMYT